EDGIRDPLVTGVQTCALPISPGTPRPVAVEGSPGSGEDFRMMREPQVVVGAHHDPLFALDDDDRVFGAGDRLVPSVQPGGLDLEIGRASCRERGEVWGHDGAV